jgi:hypothetical protein
MTRQLKLGAFMRPVSIHTGAWRYPGAYPDANFNFTHLKRFAQRLEQAKFDAFFMADQGTRFVEKTWESKEHDRSERGGVASVRLEASANGGVCNRFVAMVVVVIGAYDLVA